MGPSWVCEPDRTQGNPDRSGIGQVVSALGEDAKRMRTSADDREDPDQGDVDPARSTAALIGSCGRARSPG
jgi:hypothetical protein